MNDRPRVVHLSSVHPTHDNRILYKECRSLADAGFDTSLVVQADAPEVVGGVRIVPIKGTRSLLKRNLVTDFQAWRAALALEADIYHFHDTQLGRIGHFLARRGKRVIRDVHENPDDRMYWAPEWARPTLHKMSIRAQQRAAPEFAAVIASTPRIASFFPGESTYVIRNCPFGSDWPRIRYKSRDPRVVYAGRIAAHRGTPQLVDAIGRVAADLDVGLDLAGPIRPEALEDELRRSAGWVRTVYRGDLEPAELPKLLTAGRIGVALAVDSPNIAHEAYSTKFYEYMLAGVPIVAADFPSWRKRLGDEIGCAVFVDPTDPDAIAAAIEDLLRDEARAEEMGARGRHAVETEGYVWEQESKKLLEIYDRVLATPARGA